jgi:hypothetical protein
MPARRLNSFTDFTKTRLVRKSRPSTLGTSRRSGASWDPGPNPLRTGRLIPVVGGGSAASSGGRFRIEGLTTPSSRSRWPRQTPSNLPCSGRATGANGPRAPGSRRRPTAIRDSSAMTQRRTLLPSSLRSLSPSSPRPPRQERRPSVPLRNARTAPTAFRSTTMGPGHITMGKRSGSPARRRRSDGQIIFRAAQRAIAANWQCNPETRRAARFLDKCPMGHDRAGRYFRSNAR